MASQFSTLKDFIYMHGFGVYVWLAYGFCILLLFLFASVSFYQQKKELRILKKTIRKQQYCKKTKKVIITYE